MSDNDLIRRGDVLDIHIDNILFEYDEIYIELHKTIAAIENIPAVPQEMTARELLHIEYRMFQEDLDEWNVYDLYVLKGKGEEAIQFAEKWLKDHPERTDICR